MLSIILGGSRNFGQLAFHVTICALVYYSIFSVLLTTFVTNNTGL